MIEIFLELMIRSDYPSLSEVEDKSPHLSELTMVPVKNVRTCHQDKKDYLKFMKTKEWVQSLLSDSLIHSDESIEIDHNTPMSLTMTITCPPIPPKPF